MLNCEKNHSTSGSMPDALFKRNSYLSSAHSMVPSAGTPRWNSTGSPMEQSTLSRDLSFKMATPPRPCQLGNLLDFQVHDQDSSSTQSTGQSYPEVACVGESKNGWKDIILKESGCPGMQARPEESHAKSTLSSQDYTFQPSQDYGKLFGSVPFPYQDIYCHRILAAYGPPSMVDTQMMFMTPARVPLPLDLQQDEPIYVNAKQYRAILRRRQYRAKLEAQNKLSKARKPYLHESRHRHALNRARGPGGRFLNQKKLPESISAMTNGQDNSGFGHSRLTTKMWESEVYQLQNHKGGDPTTSFSDITTVSNVDTIFHHQEFGFSFFPSHIGGPMQHGGGGVHGGIHHHLSVPQ